MGLDELWIYHLYRQKVRRDSTQFSINPISNLNFC